MPLPNPCPCMTLRTGTKLIAIVEMVEGGIRFVLVLIALVAISVSTHPYHESVKTRTLVYLVVALVIVIVGLIVAVVLFFGAAKVNATYLLIWLIVSGILMILEIWGMIRGDRMAIISFVLNIYFMWVVWAFRKQVKENPTGHTVTPA